MRKYFKNLWGAIIGKWQSGQVNKVVMCEILTHIYNTGYHEGHNDTVESMYTHIYRHEMNTHHEEIVEELLSELQKY